jgi:hypothetical protein
MRTTIVMNKITSEVFLVIRISHGDSIKKLTLYPPAKYSTELENTLWLDNLNNDEEIIQPFFTIDQVMNFKKNIEENQIHNFLINSYFFQYFGLSSLSFDHILNAYFQENFNLHTLSSLKNITPAMNAILKSFSVPVEISQGKFLNINNKLDHLQQEQLIKILQKHSSTFAWEYSDMREFTLTLVFITFIFSRMPDPLDNPKDA